MLDRQVMTRQQGGEGARRAVVCSRRNASNPRRKSCQASSSIFHRFFLPGGRVRRRARVPWNDTGASGTTSTTITKGRQVSRTRSHLPMELGRSVSIHRPGEDSGMSSRPGEFLTLGDSVAEPKRVHPARGGPLHCTLRARPLPRPHLWVRPSPSGGATRAVGRRTCCPGLNQVPLFLPAPVVRRRPRLILQRHRSSMMDGAAGASIPGGHDAPELL